MFEALDNTKYIAPTKDKWHQDDCQSDNEEPKLKNMMEDKFGRKKLDSSESDSDGDDEGDDGGDVGATAASAPGASDAGGDKGAEYESDDNHPEPRFKFYYDDCNVRQVRRIQTKESEKDVDCVPSDTEADQLKRKETTVRRKKKS
ncbi:hypothetical protein Hanom_Chr16g01468951 [Helianthus anomalus]